MTTAGSTSRNGSRRHGRRITIALAAIALGGCASFSPDGGFGAVQKAAGEHLGPEIELAWARQAEDRDRIERRVADLLARPLGMDEAVQLALLNNRGLQAAYAELGIAEADLVQAGLPPNPGFAFARFSGGGEVEIERWVFYNLAALLAMPLRLQVEQSRFAQAQTVAAMQVLTLAADTRKAWVDAVAAEESVRYRRQVMQAAEAGAELARRMAQVGNFNKLQQLREQSFYADAATGLARAEQAQRATRERLARKLGVWGDQTGFRLPERLPDLPAQPRALPEIERMAIEQRLDVRDAKLRIEQTARNLGLTKAVRFVSVLEVGGKYSTFNDAPRETGWEIGIQIPIFDWGTARVAKAETVYLQAVDRAAETAINARSEVREAYGAYRSAWDIARHQRDEIVPLRARIAEENLLRYNGMLIGVFELLADARAQIAGVSAAIDALSDFWLAQADLDMALVGRPALTAAAAPAMAAAEPAGAGH
jgi:outer membrane protein TolC